MPFALLVWGTLQVAAVATPPGPPPVVRYRLRAEVQDTTGHIRGTAEIWFRHLRAYPLQTIDFTLEHNAHRSQSPAQPPASELYPGQAGFQHILDLRVAGRRVAPGWPRSPDSTIARLELPTVLQPGDSLLIAIEWEGRLPALDSRTDRRGRRLELVGWYPRLMEADSAKTSVPMPALADFTVVLDLAADQVVGGTGMVACGDPGWRKAEGPALPFALAGPGGALVAAAQGECGASGPGRRRVGWIAESVTEVAYAASPGFRFEVGDYGQDSVFVLYEEGGERRWGAGLTTRRTEAALAWLAEIGGEYPWPQLTVVEGLRGPGRTLPMLLLADSPGQATLLNLLGLMYTTHVLPGSNPVLAVGAAAFQAAWFFEALGGHGYYARIERQVLDWDLDRLARDLGRVEPLPEPSSTSPCTNTACRRVEFMLHQLRWWSGSDDSVKRLFRGQVERYRLRPALTGSFQTLARELILPSPDPLYTQVPRAVLYDDAVVDARRQRAPDDTWRTVVILERREEGIFPRTVRVLAEQDDAEVRLPGLAVRETVTVATRTRPRRVVLDPEVRSHDWNMLNNRRGFGLSPDLLLGRTGPSDSYLDTYFARRTARDRLTRGWAPTLWYNDRGGWVLGVRLREDYLGRFELNEAWASMSTGAGTDADHRVPQGWLVFRNPVWLRRPGWSQELAGGWLEGRAAVEAGVERRIRRGVTDSTLRTIGLRIGWLAVTDAAWLDRGYYDDAGTVEVSLGARRLTGEGHWRSGLELSLAGGWAYDAGGGAVAEGAYGRLVGSAAVRRRVAPRLALGVRAHAGAVISRDSLPRQRRLYLAGADPYERFGSPFLRSRGAILVRPGVNYHAPGGGGLRGLDPRLSGERVFAGSVEAEYLMMERPDLGLLDRLALVGFVDGGLADGDLDAGGHRLRPVADAGIGIRLDHRIGRTDVQTRVEFPVWVSRPAQAHDDSPAGEVGLRWAFGFSPSFLPR